MDLKPYETMASAAEISVCKEHLRHPKSPKTQRQLSSGRNPGLQDSHCSLEVRAPWALHTLQLAPLPVSQLKGAHLKPSERPKPGLHSKHSSSAVLASCVRQAWHRSREPVLQVNGRHWKSSVSSKPGLQAEHWPSSVLALWSRQNMQAAPTLVVSQVNGRHLLP